MPQSDTPYLLAIDAGSGSGRCIVFDATGKLVSSAQRSWAPVPVPGLEAFGWELDPDFIRRTVFELIREAVAGIDPTRIAGIGVTSQRVACAFLDDKGKALYIGPNRDIRGLQSDLAIESLIDEESLYRMTRHWPPWIFAPSRLCWFKAHAPEVFSRIRYVVGVSDWIAAELCGQIASEPTQAGDLLLLDIENRRWTEDIFDGLELNSRPLPPLNEPGTILGEISANIASECGLIANTRVAVGGGDTQLALLGSGVVSAGEVGVIAGSSAPVLMVTDNPELDPKGNLWTDCHVFNDKWLLEANAGEMGSMHKWVLEILAADLVAQARQKAVSPYILYDGEARQAPPASTGVTTHLGPRKFNLRNLNTGRPAAMLLPFGETSQLGPERPDILRAYLENCAYAIRANLELLENTVGYKAGSITLGGGMSRSELFAEITASVLNRPVLSVANWETSGLGAAICVAKAIELADSLKDAADMMVKEGQRFKPDEDDVDEYDDGYERWTELEEQLEDF